MFKQSYKKLESQEVKIVIERKVIQAWNNKYCLFYNFTFLFYLLMANHEYSLEEIRALLQTTLQDITSALFNSSQHHNQYYYQNFSGLSLRSLKYMNIYLNRTCTSHLFGGIIDSLIGKLSDSLTEYKSRNIFINSLQQRCDEQQRQQDQIYHFMNTRNTLMPLECLSDYQNQKQRKQLEDFVQSMKKHTQPPKESKRSLILPKENKFQLKMGRKATFDSTLYPIEHTTSMNNTNSVNHFQQIATNNIETQTEEIVNQDEITTYKKQENEIASQCDSFSVSECLQESLSQTKQKAPQPQKKKKKIPYEPQIKNKKRAKFNNGNLTSIKQDLHKMEKKISKIDQSNACSIKVFNNLSCLKLCSRQIQISVANYNEETTITVSFRNQYKLETLASSKNIISYHQLQTESQKQLDLKGESTKKEDRIEQEQIQKSPRDQMKQLQQKIRIKYQQAKENTMQPIHEVANSFISFSSSNKQNTDHVQQLEVSQFYNEGIFEQKATKTASLHYQSEALKLPISSVKILEKAESKQFQSQHSEFPHKYKKATKAEKQSLKKESIIKKQFKTSHPHAFYIDEQKTLQNLDIFDKNFITKQQQKSQKQKKSSEEQNLPSSRGKLQSQSISSAPSQDYLAPRDINTDIKPVKTDLILRKSKLTALRKSQILQGQTSEQSLISTSPKKLLGSQKQKHLRPQSYDVSLANGGLFVIANKNRLNSEAISRKNRDSKNKINHDNITNPKKIKLIVNQQQNGLQDKIKENQSGKTSKNASISEKTPYESCQRSSELLSQKICSKKSPKQQEERQIQSDYRKSLYHQSSCQKLLTKKGIRSLQSQIRSHSSSKSSVYYKANSSPFDGDKPIPFQLCQLRSKLRNRNYKNKLSQYLQLIEATHKKFCGQGCVHLKQLLQGSNGDVAQNILRLFKRLK